MLLYLLIVLDVVFVCFVVEVIILIFGVILRHLVDSLDILSYLEMFIRYSC